MDLLQAVASNATVDGELILVDEFLNHRVDPEIMRSLSLEMANRLSAVSPDLILTAEASGIPPALGCAIELGLPMVYAKKYLGTGSRYSYWREVTSPTKGVEYRVEVARKVVPPGRRIAIVDDFLSGGRTAEALGEITEEAGCEVAGFMFAIEKSYLDGRNRLEAHRWDVDAIVRVAAIQDGEIVLHV